MRSFAIRPYFTGLLSVTYKSGLLSKLTLATVVAFGAMHVDPAAAGEPQKASVSSGKYSTLQHALRGQLRYAVTDDKALLQAWYGARNFEPLWVTSSGLTKNGQAAIQALAQVGNEGLPPARYDLTALTTATSNQNIASQAELEVAISLAVQTYLHDLRHGAANPHAPAFGIDGLAAVEKSGFVKVANDTRPSNPRYVVLSQKLKEARSSKADKERVQDTILSLEKLRWEHGEEKSGKSYAQLQNFLQ